MNDELEEGRKIGRERERREGAFDERERARGASAVRYDVLLES